MIVNKLVLPISNSNHQGELSFYCADGELHGTVELDGGQFDIDALS